MMREPAGRVNGIGSGRQRGRGRPLLSMATSRQGHTNKPGPGQDELKKLVFERSKCGKGCAAATSTWRQAYAHGKEWRASTDVKIVWRTQCDAKGAVNADFRAPSGSPPPPLPDQPIRTTQSIAAGIAPLQRYPEAGTEKNHRLAHSTRHWPHCCCPHRLLLRGQLATESVCGAAAAGAAAAFPSEKGFHHHGYVAVAASEGAGSFVKADGTTAASEAAKPPKAARAGAQCAGRRDSYGECLRPSPSRCANPPGRGGQEAREARVDMVDRESHGAPCEGTSDP
eukprot:scaffold251433_cov30-Tisochrysis_lutea.AAC.3